MVEYALPMEVFLGCFEEPIAAVSSFDPKQACEDGESAGADDQRECEPLHRIRSCSPEAYAAKKKQ
jgi:hypothetical protein